MLHSNTTSPNSQIQVISPADWKKISHCSKLLQVSCHSLIHSLLSQLCEHNHLPSYTDYLKQHSSITVTGTLQVHTPVCGFVTPLRRKGGVSRLYLDSDFHSASINIALAWESLPYIIVGVWHWHKYIFISCHLCLLFLMGDFQFQMVNWWVTVVFCMWKILIRIYLFLLNN